MRLILSLSIIKGRHTWQLDWQLEFVLHKCFDRPGRNDKGAHVQKNTKEHLWANKSWKGYEPQWSP